MAIALTRNQITAIPHAVARANPRVGGMLRIVERGRLGNLQGGQVFKNLGFVAAMRHTSYNYEYPRNSPQLRRPAQTIAFYAALCPFGIADLSRCNGTVTVASGSQAMPRCGGVVDTPLTGWPY